MPDPALPLAVPSKQNLLERLKTLDLPISEIVDVGVRDKTQELIDAFPRLKHHLFEPVPLFYADIERNYRGLPYELHRMALSDVDETKYLTVTSVLKNGVATHSKIDDTARPTDGQETLSCTPIELRRFDSLPNTFLPDFLLKVDVDGFDLRVLKGFGSRLRQASVVIVEATYNTLLERTQYLAANGFQLIDVVDIVYYGAALYQLDLAFVRNSLASDKLRPSIVRFDPSLWRAFIPK